MEAKEKFYLNVCERDYQKLVSVIQDKFKSGDLNIRLDYEPHFRASQYLVRPDYMIWKKPESLSDTTYRFFRCKNETEFFQGFDSERKIFNYSVFIAKGTRDTLKSLYRVIDDWVKPIITRFDGV